MSQKILTTSERTPQIAQPPPQNAAPVGDEQHAKAALRRKMYERIAAGNAAIEAEETAQARWIQR